MLNKKIYILLPILLIGLAVFLFFQRPTLVLADDISLIVYEHNGESTGVAGVRVPFQVSSNNDVLNIYIDNELVAENVPVAPVENWSNTYSFVRTLTNDKSYLVRVVLGKQSVEKVLLPEVRDAGGLLDLTTITDPENATKGIISTVRAEEPVVEITQSDVPDLTQQTAECGPTVAANGIIALTNRHGTAEQKEKVKNSAGLISELKTDMKWTRENGTPPDLFVAGKNAWAQKNGFPIRTEKLGDANGLQALGVIQQALADNNAVVELRVAFADANGKQAGGHIVSVTGFHQGYGQTYLEVNDPASPEGSDMYEIRGNVLSNYGYFNGHTVLSWVIVERWGQAPVESAGASTSLDTEKTQGVPIEVIDYNGLYIPVDQLHIGEIHPPHDYGEGCPAQHWHADGQVSATDGTVLADPNAGGCGFGTLSERPIVNITLPAVQVKVRGLEGLR